MAARASDADDPIERFQEWFREAEQAGVEVPEAMTLATADCRSELRPRGWSC